jgi:multisubunit Na+/H+ antiporter MnhB subunit
MRKFAGIVVLAVGIALVVWGANASKSVSSDISRFFTGAVTNKAIYLIVGGAVAMIAGASFAFNGRAKRA